MADFHRFFIHTTLGPRKIRWTMAIGSSGSLGLSWFVQCIFGCVTLQPREPVVNIYLILGVIHLTLSSLSIDIL